MEANMSQESFSRRAANFTAEEVDLLIDLIKNKKHIIECKKTDRILWKEKDVAWEDIAAQFNQRYGQIYRSASVLRKKYENIKKRTKQKFADNRCQVTGTGGGPSSQVTFTHVDEEVKEMLGVRLEGLPCYFDSDAANVTPQPTEEIQILVTEDDIEPPASSSKEPQERTWEYHAPSMLSQPISSVLKRTIDGETTAAKVAKKRKVTGTHTNEKWASLADDKANYVALQTRCLIEEHQLKIELLQDEKHLKKLQIEEQQLKNDILKLEFEAQKKYLDSGE